MSLRDTVSAFLKQDKYWEAFRVLEDERQRPLDMVSARFVESCMEKIRPEIELRPFKVLVLRSFTLEPLAPYLRAQAFLNRIDLDIDFGGFDSYVQDILSEKDSLYQPDPAMVIVAVQTRDLVSEFWDGFSHLSAEERDAIVQRVTNNVRTWLGALRSRTKADILIHNFEVPVFASAGILDAQEVSGQVEAIRRINRELVRLASEERGVHILDYDSLVARHGRLKWHDEGKWQAVRMPLATDSLKFLAQEWFRFICPLAGKACKVLVSDLDNTLWGGVLGEEGIEGIQVGKHSAYRALQQALLDISQRGVMLAICSRNDEAQAMHVLERHPQMLLRRKNFAAQRINWKEKANNLLGIASELNVGIDTLAFLDDDAVERERIKALLPEVTVIDLPPDPAAYATTLRNTPCFERVSLSEEDSQRHRYYTEERRRTELKERSASLEAFYKSLCMEVRIEFVTPESAARVAQLTQKTNQFNLNPSPLSESEILDIATRSDTRVYALRSGDRFGDNGVVGVAILSFSSSVCAIDGFLISCRVIGRTLETAFLCRLIQVARDSGATTFEGTFRPTQKNVPASSFFSKHHFRPAGEDASGALRWRLDLAKDKNKWPTWIVLKGQEASLCLT
jgi:FkbH-like protein